MENKNSIFAEVVIDFFDKIKNHWTVDTWKTDDDNEEGVVVARINLKGEIEWEVEEAKNDPFVKEELERFFDNRLFSIKDENCINDEIVKYIKSMSNNDEKGWSILSKDGNCQYDIEKKYILGTYKHCAGFDGCDVFRVEELSRDDDYERFADWILEDINTGTGDEYVIQLDY